MALAAGGVLAGAAPPTAVQSGVPSALPAGTNQFIPSVQVQSELSRPGMATNAVANIALYQDLTMEPRLAWGSNRRVSGLFVDLIRPQQTWDMLLAPGAAPGPVRSEPAWPVTQTVCRPDGDQGVHDANFAILRVSFP
jgi:hypothetical protein